MRRPTRTRRLSIAAIVSLLLFGAVTSVAIRSVWIENYYTFGRFTQIAIYSGCVRYLHVSGDQMFFSSPVKSSCLVLPLWPLMIVLLIDPVCWLVARPTNAPAFPVITDAKNEA